MRVELAVLGLSIGLGFVHILLAAHSAYLQRGYAWAASSRDEPMAPMKGKAGRLQRALRNFNETFPFFVAAVVLALATHQQSWMTTGGAGLYISARALYLPAYAFDVIYVRSALWNIATGGIILMIVGAFA